MVGLGEIAAYFRKSPRTIERWNRDRGLPLHRLSDKSRSRVFALISELREWSEESGERTAAAHDDIADRIVARVSDLSQAKNLYRKDFCIRFVLEKSGLGVKATIETTYRIVNGSNKYQPYTQEVTIDDCESGYVELMSVSVNGKQVTLLQRPSPTKHHPGYSSYKARTILIDPSSSGKRWTGVAKWVVYRRDSDFWYLHCGIATLGIKLETFAPNDFEITAPFTSPELLTIGQHIDVTWKRRASSPRR